VHFLSYRNYLELQTIIDGEHVSVSKQMKICEPFYMDFISKIAAGRVPPGKVESREHLHPNTPVYLNNSLYTAVHTDTVR